MQGGRGRTAPRRGSRIAGTSGTRPAAILVAGGLGQRASASPEHVTKQFRPLRGKLVFEWSLEALVRFGCEPVVCVLPSKYPEAVHRATDSEGVLTTTGGATRQESVAAGLELVDTRTVVVHDAARPLVTEAMLKEVTAPLTEFVGAITALRMSETIKRADRDLVVETIDRSSLWRSQTPQAFRTEELRRAHNKAREESFVATDDAQLIERYGGRVAIVPGDPSNIKLTYEEDFIIAEALLAHRGAAGR